MRGLPEKFVLLSFRLTVYIFEDSLHFLASLLFIYRCNEVFQLIVIQDENIPLPPILIYAHVVSYVIIGVSYQNPTALSVRAMSSFIIQSVPSFPLGSLGLSKIYSKNTD